MEVLRLERVEVTDSWGVELTAAQWSQGGSRRLLMLLAVYFLRDRKSSLKNRWARCEQTDIHKRETQLVIASETM